jgi:hypothetical protein
VSPVTWQLNVGVIEIDWRLIYRPIGVQCHRGAAALGALFVPRKAAGCDKAVASHEVNHTHFPL